ncbi:lipid-A-disaccharide synthase [Mariprofundus micogutta]|uniref:Lipid-A-disaccharide synthase n=1 Tax=Mariprofundus micogutta TaxID=1921010 RepID=A0A1L8CJX1_9PROT|nr:lipid-A-disaccharide synthase [Mariprofundus micogutta]GAV19190.1 lipid-A-disaccharide synthase [Mariprofundus micogutta]
MRQFFVSAGETSGDFHAATVVAELKSRFPEVEVTGVAGSQMIANGCMPLHHMNELNVMGISDVLRSLARIRSIEVSILNWCASNRPEVAVLVDFSSFHMRLGRKLRNMGIPVIHFIAPKLWAWGSWRVKKLQQSQDRLASILPFEIEWFALRGISATYVGNPSAVACERGWSAAELRHKLGLEPEQKLLALLPGSRPQELKAHIPVLAESLRKLRAELPELACVVPLAPGVEKEQLELLWKAGAVAIQRQEHDYALRADAAIAVSGTATLELALWNVPTVLVYQSSPLMVFLAKRLVKLRCAGLANIILGDRPVMPELIQQDCTVENIVHEILPLLQNSDAAEMQRDAFCDLREVLGNEKPAKGVADMVEQLIH